MFESLALLLFSLAVLALSADFVVDHAVRLARFFKLSNAAVGFLLVSVATSLPELAVGLQSALRGEVALSVGNVLGANLADIALIGGLMAFTAGFIVSREDYADLTKALLIASVLPLFLLLDLGKLTGVILILVFAVFFASIIRKRVELGGLAEVSKREAAASGVLFAAGLTGVFFSSDFVVSSALSISSELGLAQAFVGAAILALGTTLPELMVSLTAIKKGNVGLALGNIAGSCVTNLGLVLGSASLIQVLDANRLVFFELVAFTVGANALFWFFTGRGRLGRWEGAALLAVYFGFLLVVFSSSAA